MIKKVFIFEFPGTREDLLNRLNQFNYSASYSRGTLYYLDDYIVELIGEEIRFGVARGSHSGGYWFVPTITDLGDRLEFYGKMRYIGPNEKRGFFRKAIERVGDFLLLILLLPAVRVGRRLWRQFCIYGEWDQGLL